MKKQTKKEENHDMEKSTPEEMSDFPDRERLIHLYGKWRETGNKLLCARRELAWLYVQDDKNSASVTTRIKRKSKTVVDLNDERYRLELEIAALETDLKNKGITLPYRYSRKEVLAFLCGTERMLVQKLGRYHLTSVRVNTLVDMIKALE